VLTQTRPLPVPILGGLHHQFCDRDSGEILNARFFGAHARMIARKPSETSSSPLPQGNPHIEARASRHGNAVELGDRTGIGEACLSRFVSLRAPPETPPSRRHAGRAARRQPAQCRASSAPARSAENCSSGPEVNEKKLCKRAFCSPRKSAKLMLVVSPESFL
jgi:hypothetical protein